MKYILAFLLTAGVHLSCKSPASTIANADAKSDSLTKTIRLVIEAFHDKDAATLNQRIHKDYGLAVIFREGVFDQYQITENVNFDRPVPQHWPYPDFTPNYDLRYEALPKFDCGTEKWSKRGLYLDKSTRDNILSKTAMNLNRYVGAEIPQETIDKFKAIERKSHRVVLVDKEGKSLIFYLSLIDNRWYLTILDRVTGDCSA